MKKLVIVESPAKAKTIAKYLGKDVKVVASYGHVRDLLPKNGAVDINNDFAMQYVEIPKSKDKINKIAEALKNSKILYLATDPDREGEAISWHICEIMEKRRLLEGKEVHRVAFHEITKKAINEAINNPREISMSLVNAQQARRALDYLVGFNLSPLLWKKIRRGLSAGRVQSPALRMIVEREHEIEKFVKQEYWTINADLLSKDQEFCAKLITYENKKLEQFSFPNEEKAKEVEENLTKISNGKLIVLNVEKKQRKRNPSPPFTTSTLQQEAVRKLGFTAQRTMRIAQQLYEGIDIGNEVTGLITYMRTDSVNLSEEALSEIRGLIADRYGKENLPEKPCYYKTKSKNAQEAHECIRQTSALRFPEQLKNYLNNEQLQLYSLIWKRTIASQMIPATINTVAIDLGCGDGNIFRANGSNIANHGFISVYKEGSDSEKEDSDEEGLLPTLNEGDIVDLIKISGNQHFTAPPPRYTEASLIKSLEEHGIGRPSTYTTIIATLQNREYVILENKQFKPTVIGDVVNKFLTENFTQYVNYEFTANLEDKLDDVANGDKKWIPLLREFWEPFNELIKTTEKAVNRKDFTQQTIDEACPECGKQLSIRLGKLGKFIGCSGYPECKYTRPVDNTDEDVKQLDRNCPECGSALQYKHGKYGKFIGCSKYPDCNFMESLNKPFDTMIKCPECKQGTLLKRKSRYGKIFYSCSKYPDCKYALWNEPINEQCPKCKWPILTVKVTQKKGTEKVCPKNGCGYSAPLE